MEIGTSQSMLNPINPDYVMSINLFWNVNFFIGVRHLWMSSMGGLASFCGSATLYVYSEEFY